MSKTAPVEKEQAGELSQATSSATSAGRPTRPIGILPTMYCTISWLTWRKMSVSMTAGVAALKRMPDWASSLPSALVRPITPALAAESGARFGLPSLPAMDAMLTMAPVLQRRPDHRFHAGRVRHIGADGERPGAGRLQRVGLVPGGLDVDVGKGHPQPITGQPTRNGQADAPGGTGHNGCPPVVHNPLTRRCHCAVRRKVPISLAVPRMWPRIARLS